MTPQPSPHPEERLSKIPRRRLPPDLRAACIDLARAGAPATPAPARTASRRTATPGIAWLWPHPAAWASLGAAWCAILALHRLAPRPIHILAATGPSVPLMLAPDVARQLALQRETREESLRPLPHPSPLDIDRPRNAAPPSTNRIA